jgi:PilZ domain
LRGAKVMSTAMMSPGDRLAISLRVPDQATTIQLDAMVRWMKDQMLGLEFISVPPSAESRLKKFLARSTDTCA